MARKRKPVKLFESNIGPVTAEGRKFTDEIRKAVSPIVDKYLKRGADYRHLAYLIESESRLHTVVKVTQIRLKEQNKK